MGWWDKIVKPVARDAGKAAKQSVDDSVLKSIDDELLKLRDKKLTPAQLNWVRRIHNGSGEILASQGAM